MNKKITVPYIMFVILFVILFVLRVFFKAGNELMDVEFILYGFAVGFILRDFYRRYKNTTQKENNNK